MKIRQQAIPVLYPVSRDEAKLFCRIPTSNTLEDSLVDLLIASAVGGVEKATGLMLASRKYVGYIDAFPAYPFTGNGFFPLFGAPYIDVSGVSYPVGGVLVETGRFPFAVSIPVEPVTAIEKIVYIDLAGNSQTLLPGVDFAVDLGSSPVRVGPLPNGHWPLQTVGLSSVQVFFTAGFTTPQVVNITNVSLTGGLLTITGTNTLLASQQVLFANLQSAAFLNGQIVTVATASQSQFTASFTAADYASHSDTGTATTTEVNDVVISGAPTPPNQTAEFKFTTGIPMRLKHLLLLMINEGYLNRNIHVASQVGTIPMAQEILDLYTTHDFTVDRS